MKNEIKPPRHPHQDGDEEKNLAQLAGELDKLTDSAAGRKPPTILHGRIDHLRQLITKKDATRRTTIIK
jgi:hypothetical protein